MNAKETELVDRFIELRADLIPFQKIAKDLDVALRTLYYWSHKYQVDIENRRAIQEERHTQELGLSRHQCRQALGEELRRLREELAKRDLKDVSTAQLVRLIAQLSTQAERFNGPIQLSQAIPESSFETMELPDPVVSWPA